MSADADVRHMRRALELAGRGWGRVHPNPLVGAVLVREGEIVGEGHHAEWGGPHAEVEAIRSAGERTHGAVLYVNLEPCHHRGKTGPCSEAIAAAGIRRVVYAMADPNPEAGGGGRWLSERGIEVESGVCEVEARELNAPHVIAQERERPFVALKYAMSLDGRLSRRPGEPTRVTEGAAIREAHRLRAGHAAVLVGIGTVLADDPRLTVREGPSSRQPPVRIVLDSGLRIKSDARVVRTAREVPTWVIASEDVPESASDRLCAEGVEVLRAPRAAGGDGLNLADVLATLWAREVRSILCEGGGTLGSALLREGFIDRMYLFMAPRLFGEPGVAAFEGPRGCAAAEWDLLGHRELDGSVLLILSAGVGREG